MPASQVAAADFADREEQVLAVLACGPPVRVRKPPRAKLRDVRDLRHTDKGQAANAHAAEDDCEKSQRMQRNSRDHQIGVRSIDNDKAPAVPLACAGTRCVQLARLFSFPPELSKDSHRRRLGGAWERALCQYGGDCGGSIGDRDCIGPVEGTEKSPGDLRDCLIGPRPRSCRGENGLIHKK